MKLPNWFKKASTVFGIVTIALVALAIVGWISVTWFVSIPHFV